MGGELCGFIVADSLHSVKLKGWKGGFSRKYIKETGKLERILAITGEVFLEKKGSICYDNPGINNLFIIAAWCRERFHSSDGRVSSLG